jgi:Na+/H+ antiporter NhaC
VWGDHCSPISDTTILSSLASGCDHIEHVRTQLPYAITVGATSILTGSVLTALGSPWWVGILLGLAVLWTILRLYGKRSALSQEG